MKKNVVFIGILVLVSVGIYFLWEYNNSTSYIDSKDRPWYDPLPINEEGYVTESQPLYLIYVAEMEKKPVAKESDFLLEEIMRLSINPEELLYLGYEEDLPSYQDKLLLVKDSYSEHIMLNQELFYFDEIDKEYTLSFEELEKADNKGRLFVGEDIILEVDTESSTVVATLKETGESIIIEAGEIKTFTKNHEYIDLKSIVSVGNFGYWDTENIQLLSKPANQ